MGVCDACGCVIKLFVNSAGVCFVSVEFLNICVSKPSSPLNFWWF